MTIFETSTAFSDNKETHSHNHSIEPGGESLEWKPIYTEKELHRAAKKGGNFYLAVDIYLTRKLEIIKNMNLCLNDKVLKQTAAGRRVITIPPNIHFNLCDCSGENGTTRYWDKDKDGLWTLKTDDSPSDYTTHGGVITGGDTLWGGGVENYGDFTMYGGNIIGNSATNGGGVYNWMYATFMLNGGNITGNSAKTGGGVYAYHNSTFTPNGGNISGNNAEYGYGDV